MALQEWMSWTSSLYSLDMFGLLAYFGYKYVKLPNMILSEQMLDKRVSSLSIKYIAEVEMFPIRISNDRSLHFYLEHKH